MMKLRQMILSYAGLLGAITLAALLYSVRGLLPGIAVKVLIVLLVLAGATAAYLAYWLYSRFHKTYHENQARRYDLEARKQQIRIEAEAHAVDMHIKLSRLFADPNGNYPVLIPGRIDLLPSQIASAGEMLALPPGQIRGGRQRLPEPDTSDGQQDTPALPTLIHYDQIRSQIPRGHALLGVSAEGRLETCDFSQLMTMWICGGSSTGKSNTVALKIDEAIRNGRRLGIICIDPHARKEDSLYNKIRCYESRFLLPVAVSEDEILHALQEFHREFKRRLAIGGGDTDILLVVDEVSNVVASEDERIGKLIKEIARICGQESRGFGMFGWFISQRAAGLAWLRNVVITVIAHKMNMMNERKLACNEDMEIARSMTTWPRGRVAVYGLAFDDIKILQMPIFSAPAIEAGRGSGAVYVEEIEPMEALQPLPTSAFPSRKTQQSETQPNRPESAQEKGGNGQGQEHQIDVFTLKHFLSDARKRRAEGTPLNTILKEYGLPSGGRTHQEIKELLDAMDRDRQGEQAANE